MDEIIEILEDLKPGFDYETQDNLVADRILDSLTIIALVAELEDNFDITIPAVEVIEENFHSAAALSAMVDRLVEAQN